MSPARYQRKPKAERTWNGRVYDSCKEMQWAVKFHALASAGKIQGLTEQVPFVLVPKHRKGQRDITYRADFVFFEDGSRRVVDIKGHKTQLYELKKRLMQHVHGIEVEEI